MNEELREQLRQSLDEKLSILLYRVVGNLPMANADQIAQQCRKEVFIWVASLSPSQLAAMSGEAPDGSPWSPSEEFLDGYAKGCGDGEKCERQRLASLPLKDRAELAGFELMLDSEHMPMWENDDTENRPLWVARSTEEATDG
jgi:hypothetical protein